MKVSLFDFDSISNGQLKIAPTIEEGEKILYRGWMMSPEKYSKFVDLVMATGGVPITDSLVKCQKILYVVNRCLNDNVISFCKNSFHSIWPKMPLEQVNLIYTE